MKFLSANCIRGLFILLRQRDFTRLNTSSLFLSTCKLSIIWLHSADRKEHHMEVCGAIRRRKLYVRRLQWR